MTSRDSPAAAIGVPARLVVDTILTPSFLRAPRVETGSSTATSPTLSAPPSATRSAAARGAVGAIVSLHAGAFDPRADYAALQPVKTARVPLGTVAASLPALDGPHTAVARAWIDVPATGTYTLHPGFGDSTHAVAAIDGQEVYRREPGGKLGGGV